VDAVTGVVEAVFTEPEEKSEAQNTAAQPKRLRHAANGDLWERSWVPQGVKAGQMSTQVVEMVGERGFEPPTPWSRNRARS
jgi:hypothetical protein